MHPLLFKKSYVRLTNHVKKAVGSWSSVLTKSNHIKKTKKKIMIIIRVIMMATKRDDVLGAASTITISFLIL